MILFEYESEERRWRIGIVFAHETTPFGWESTSREKNQSSKDIKKKLQL